MKSIDIGEFDYYLHVAASDETIVLLSNSRRFIARWTAALSPNKTIVVDYRRSRLFRIIG